MTSNLGSDLLIDGLDSSGEIPEKVRTQISEILQKNFRPEFLNRLDEIIVFDTLEHDSLSEIIGIQMGIVEKRLADKEIKLKLISQTLPLPYRKNQTLANLTNYLVKLTTLLINVMT